MTMNFFEQNFSNRVNETLRWAHASPFSPRQVFQPASLEDHFLISGMNQAALADWNQQHQATSIDALMTGITSCLGLMHPSGTQFSEKMERSDVESLLYACQLFVSNSGINRTKGLFRLHLLTEVSKLAGKPMRYQIIADHIAEGTLSSLKMGFTNGIVDFTSGGALLMSNGLVTLIVTQTAIYNLAHFRKDFLMKYFSKIADIETLYEKAIAPLEPPFAILQETVRLIARTTTKRTLTELDDHCAVATLRLLETDSIRVVTPDGIPLIEMELNGETHVIVEEKGEFIDITNQGRKTLAELDVVTLGTLSLHADQLNSVLFSKNVRSEFISGFRNKATALLKAISEATGMALQKAYSVAASRTEEATPAQTQPLFPDYTPVITEVLLHVAGSGDVSSSSSQVSFKGSQTNYTITGIQPGEYSVSIKIKTSENKEVFYKIDMLTPKDEVCPVLSMTVCQEDTITNIAIESLAMLKVLRDQLDELVSGKGNLPGAFFSDMYILLQRLNDLLKTD